ncbi:hypothetical protein EDD22DRAFT_935609, partial [Suillus occidentalis]
MNTMYNDMPPLVDASTTMPRPRIPPPAAATFMAGYPLPQNAFAGQGGWNAPAPQPYPPFQTGDQEQMARWAQYCQNQVAPAPPSMPSPYVPHLPMNPMAARQGLRGRSNSFSAPGPSNLQQQAAAWNAWGPATFQNNARPPMQTFPSTSSHTPASAISMNRPLSTAYSVQKAGGRGFKFKSGISSLLTRSRSVSRPPDAMTDSARLHSPIILDLRRSQHLLIIEALRRPVVANDLMQPSTNPPTLFMRLYHTRLPWYI